eukprot:6046365-Pyramimonas_sp.AAC.1
MQASQQSCVMLGLASEASAAQSPGARSWRAPAFGLAACAAQWRAAGPPAAAAPSSRPAPRCPGPP